MAGYKEIADVIMENIASGVLPPGTPVPSLHTICKEFKVSYMTAVHAHEELARRGLIIRNPAFRKTLVGATLPESKRIPLTLKKIVLIHSVFPAKKANPQYSNILPVVTEELERKCREHGLEFECMYDRLVSWAEAGKTMKGLQQDTGYIFAGNITWSNEGRLHFSSLVAMSEVPAKVFIDHIVPKCHCVINDYNSCVDLLVKQLKKQGVREILYLRKCFVLSNYYSRERYEACAIACQKEKILMNTLEGTNFTPVLDFVKKNTSSKAIICPQDTVADNCRIFLEKNGIKEKALPVIAGMDGVSFAVKQWRKLTVKFDVRSMAEKAFVLAINSSPSDVIHNIEKLPGKLVLPEEWEEERRKY